MIILFVQVLVANWKRSTNCCVSTFGETVFRLVAEQNLQLDDLCKKKKRLVFRYKILVCSLSVSVQSYGRNKITHFYSMFTSYDDCA